MLFEILLHRTIFCKIYLYYHAPVFFLLTYLIKIFFKILTFSIVIILQTFENIKEQDYKKNIASVTNKCCDKCFLIKSIKYMLGMQLFFIYILKSILKNFLQLIKIWLYLFSLFIFSISNFTFIIFTLRLNLLLC